MTKLLTSFLLLVSFSAFGIEIPSQDELDSAETTELDVGEEPLVLEEVIVTGVQFTFKQEAALRMVRQALKQPKSLKREDWDTWVCWYRKPVGTHRTYLECARNGDLAALKPDAMMGNTFLGGRSVGSGYGTIMRSNRPVNKKTFEAMLNNLPGSDDFDQEFVGMALAGQEPPRDIPTDAELDSFSAAYKHIG